MFDDTHGHDGTIANDRYPPAPPHCIREVPIRPAFLARQVIDDEAEAIARVATDRALAGDMTGVRLCLERSAPVRRHQPVRFDLPPIETAEDAEKGSAAVLAAVSAGEITALEAAPIMGLVMAHVQVLKRGAHERRLAALEAALHQSRAARRDAARGRGTGVRQRWPDPALAGESPAPAQASAEPRDMDDWAARNALLPDYPGPYGRPDAGGG